jgi:hypothetical protein
MFNSNVLEVGVGLIFTFLAVSLITGAIVETIHLRRGMAREYAPERHQGVAE